MDTKEKKDIRRTGKKPATGPSPGGKRRNTTAPAKQQSAADVVYLAPKPFSRNRLILHLATVAAVVVALILGFSVFFKVEHFSVSGAQKYSAWDIQKASGIREGDNLIMLNRTAAAGKIIAAMPYVKQARVGIKLPDTVNIEIIELEVTYSVKSQDGSWWLVSADGKVVDTLTAGQEEVHTKLLGVLLQAPKVGEKAVAAEESQIQTDPQGNTVPVVITAADRLNTALDITQYLEQNGEIGSAASVDVNNLGDIQIWFGAVYQIKLGDSTQLSYKIQRMVETIRDFRDNRPYESGVLDIANPDEIYYKRFE